MESLLNHEKDVHVIYQIKIEININNDELLRIIWEHMMGEKKG
jgi:hypothetical protein